MPALALWRDERGSTFAYEGDTPAGEALIAAHCPAGPAADPWGNACSAGLWVADGYEADSAPLPGSAYLGAGVFLRRALPPLPPELAELAEPAPPRPLRVRDILAWR